MARQYTTIMSAPAVLRVCRPPPVNTTTSVIPNAENAVMARSKQLWDIGSTITYAFLDGTDNQHKAVEQAIGEWKRYANIKIESSSKETALVRIAFDPSKGSWSTVGTDAKLTGTQQGQTMNLGWVSDAYPPSKEDYEWGHVLGMMHEHQSPARGEFIHLKESAVYAYYRPLLQYRDDLVKSQVIDEYSLDSVSNFSMLDINSIMMYFMPAYLNEEGLDVPVNKQLSELDKAFITINYPRENGSAGPEEPDWTLAHALDIAGVPHFDAAVILDCKNPTDMRSAFVRYNSQVMALTVDNQHLLHSIVMNGTPEHGILDTLGTLTKNPLFTGILKGVVTNVLGQSGIRPNKATAGTAQNDILGTIGSLVTSPAFTNLITGMVGTLLDLKPVQQKPSSS